MAHADIASIAITCRRFDICTRCGQPFTRDDREGPFACCGCSACSEWTGVAPFFDRVAVLVRSTDALMLATPGSPEEDEAVAAIDTVMESLVRDLRLE
jgi:hypothetical protein